MNDTATYTDDNGELREITLSDVKRILLDTDPALRNLSEDAWEAITAYLQNSTYRVIKEYGRSSNCWRREDIDVDDIRYIGSRCTVYEDDTTPEEDDLHLHPWDPEPDDSAIVFRKILENGKTLTVCCF